MLGLHGAAGHAGFTELPDVPAMDFPELLRDELIHHHHQPGTTNL